ncbi:MAG: DUF6164 family protein [Gammaproteobacteria bacterium]|nr:DUF6164 family protein [Gammaproteobacteria bacterium]
MIRLFSLDGVSSDEENEIRELLEENNIEFYETPHGDWGFSQAAIWLRDDSKLREAKELIATYQREREKKERAKYINRSKNRPEGRLLDKIKSEPALYAFLLLVFATLFWMLVFGVKR